MQKITFEQLPEAVSLLMERLERIENLLLSIKAKEVKELEPEILTITQAANLLELSEATIYSKVSRSEIPANKAGKKVYFFKHELIEWVKAGRRKTDTELQAEAGNRMRAA